MAIFENPTKMDRILFIFLILFVAFSVISIAGTQISLFLIAIFTMINAVLTRKWPFGKTNMDPAFLTFSIAVIISTIFSPEPAESFTRLKNLLLFVVVYLVGFNLKTRDQIRTVTDVFVFTAAILALAGIAMADVFGGKRVMALQSTTMTWGAMSGIFTLLTAALFLFANEGKKRWFYGAAFLLQFVSMIFSYVRGAWIGFFSGLMILALVKSKKLFFGAVILVIFALLISPAPIKNRMMTITDLSINSTQVRLTQWKNSINMIKDRPVVGVGWIDLGELHRQYAPPGADLNYHAYQIGHFHNNYIMFLVLFGVVGFAAAIFLIVRMFRMCIRIFNGLPEDESFFAALILGVIAGLAGFWINGIFDWTFGDAEPVTLVWMVIGLVVAVGRQTKP